jgi:SpoVK/Ycf46/Vps4 family AAA+-type ATPase
MTESFFKLKHVNKINEIADKFSKGEEVIINTSDLSIQNEDYFLQFELIRNEVVKVKVELKSGVFNIEKSSTGLVFVPMELQEAPMLETSKAYQDIEKEFNNFFDRLDVYDELGILKKRGVLLFGPAGTGKSANVSKSLRKLKSQGDTAIVMWNASSIRSDEILALFSTGIEYNSSVKKLVIVIEDIGMGVEGYGGPKEIDRSLLNLLDGANSVVQVPTFMVATTNYAHNLPEPLIRPGRFDAWIEVGVPSANERVSLIEFFIKSALTEDDKKAIMGKDLNEFSIAHIKELVLRTKRDDKGYSEVIKELKTLKDKFNKGFDDKKGTGLL